MGLLTDEQLQQAIARRNEIRAEKGLPPVDVEHMVLKPLVSKSIQIAALFLLEVSYGQLVQLFEVATATIYVATLKNIPPAIRAKRKRSAGKPSISFEQASMYYEAIPRAVADLGPEVTAIRLAAHIQQITKGVDWKE